MTSTQATHSPLAMSKIFLSQVDFFCIVLTIFLLPLVVGACQSASSEKGIVGVWNDGYTFIRFSEDGKWEVAGMFESLEADRPLSWGTYYLDENLMSFETDDESFFCPGGVGTYEIEYSDQGDLIFTMIEEECGGRKFDLTRGSYSRYTP